MKKDEGMDGKDRGRMTWGGGRQGGNLGVCGGWRGR